jgi:hypothetical protein
VGHYVSDVDGIPHAHTYAGTLEPEGGRKRGSLTTGLGISQGCLLPRPSLRSAQQRRRSGTSGAVA